MPRKRKGAAAKQKAEEPPKECEEIHAIELVAMEAPPPPEKRGSTATTNNKGKKKEKKPKVKAEALEAEEPEQQQEATKEEEEEQDDAWGAVRTKREETAWARRRAPEKEHAEPEAAEAPAAAPVEDWEACPCPADPAQRAPRQRIEARTDRRPPRTRPAPFRPQQPPRRHPVPFRVPPQPRNFPRGYARPPRQPSFRPIPRYGRRPLPLQRAPAQLKLKMCHACGAYDHVMSACPSPAQSVCFSCGKKGHFAANCPSPSKKARQQGEKRCCRCGKPGHFAKNCTEPNTAY